jgi:hypothetical protein
LLPGAGPFLDLTSAAVSLYRGDVPGAVLDLVSAIPGFGDGTAGLAKLAVRSSAAAAVIAGLANLGRKLRKGCFVAGTAVVTAEGTVPIELVRSGDWVLSRSDTTGAVAWKQVVRTFQYANKRVLDLALEAENHATEILGVTGEHPFWVRNAGWTPAGQLLPGMEVLTSKGGWVRVAGSTWRAQTETVYNFEVDEFHTYFVGRTQIWVHNSCSERARAARDKLLDAINNLPISNRRKAEITTVGGGYDPDTGRVAAAAKIGEKGCRTFCVEDLTYELLGRPKRPKFSPTKRPRTGEVVDPCPSCLKKYGPEAFE